MDNNQVISALLDETIDVYVEDHRDNGLALSTATFVVFVQENLPPDVLLSLQIMLGVGDDDDDAEGSWLADLFEMRFPSKEEDEDGISGDGGTRGSSKECSICERQCKLTRHHVYPKETHTLHRFRSLSIAELSFTIAICKMCHATIHRLYTNLELAESFHSLQLLLDDEKMQRYARWASSQGDRQNGRIR